MARIRNKKSKLSYGGLGLNKDEDKQLLQKLQRENLSLRQLLQNLVRNWMSDAVPGN